MISKDFWLFSSISQRRASQETPGLLRIGLTWTLPDSVPWPGSAMV
ncbi:MAG: hypothetical protein ACRDHN_09320 [Thermomicrobiales bacterium]